MPMHHKKSLGPVLPDRRDKRAGAACEMPSAVFRPVGKP